MQITLACSSLLRLRWASTAADFTSPASYSQRSTNHGMLLEEIDHYQPNQNQSVNHCFLERDQIINHYFLVTICFQMLLENIHQNQSINQSLHSWKRSTNQSITIFWKKISLSEIRKSINRSSSSWHFIIQSSLSWGKVLSDDLKRDQIINQSPLILLSDVLQGDQSKSINHHFLETACFHVFLKEICQDQPISRRILESNQSIDQSSKQAITILMPAQKSSTITDSGNMHNMWWQTTPILLKLVPIERVRNTSRHADI